MIKAIQIFILSIFIIIINQTNTLACEVCGCGNGGSFFGILPQSHKGFIGLRYSYKSYDSHLSSVNLKAREDFWKTELWARAYPFKKVQVLTFVPYLINQQTIQKTGKELHLNGLGDVTALANYNIINTVNDTVNHRFNHNLLVGGGVKLPTGKYKYDLLSETEVANANFQLGTGIIDFLLNLVYTIRHKDWGLNYDFSYKINTQNSDNYTFGNRLNTNLALLYFQKINSDFTVIPNVGISFENAELDIKNKIRNTQTGGYSTFGSVGVESYYKNVSFGINYQKPIMQDLSGGELNANARLNLHFTVLI